MRGRSLSATSGATPAVSADTRMASVFSCGSAMGRSGVRPPGKTGELSGRVTSPMATRSTLPLGSGRSSNCAASPCVCCPTMYARTCVRRTAAMTSPAPAVSPSTSTTSRPRQRGSSRDVRISSSFTFGRLMENNTRPFGEKRRATSAARSKSVLCGVARRSSTSAVGGFVEKSSNDLSIAAMFSSVSAPRRM